MRNNLEANRLVDSGGEKGIGIDIKGETEAVVLSKTSPLSEQSKEILVAMDGFNGTALAVKVGGSGDVTESGRLWHHPKTK